MLSYEFNFENLLSISLQENNNTQINVQDLFSNNNKRPVTNKPDSTPTNKYQ
jgi:hypothetical protein